MPAIRAHDPVMDDIDDDGLGSLSDVKDPSAHASRMHLDGMPPLIEKTNAAMTFTFFTDMTPITYSNDPTTLEIHHEEVLSAPPSPALADDPPMGPRVSHSKKRDASYIPRPPNAFILFRSSFIRSQQVPGKVEGNHSTLSKIVGLYWKTLPREEREIWEAKALVAQAEHRKRYPDWRFRPGANALAKLKVKDGGGNQRKRGSHVRKAKNDDAEAKGRMKEQRCAKIADLLVEGKKGSDLAAAVKQWEYDEKNWVKGASISEHSSQGNGTKDARGKEDSSTPSRKAVPTACAQPLHTEMEGHANDVVVKHEGTAPPFKEPARFLHRCQTPDRAFDARFKVPLTSMFRRSLSAPASNFRCPSPPFSDRLQSRGSHDIPDSARTDHHQSPMATYVDGAEDVHASMTGANEQVDFVAPLVTPPMSEDPVSCPWNNADLRNVSSEDRAIGYDTPTTPSLDVGQEVHINWYAAHATTKSNNWVACPGNGAFYDPCCYSSYQSSYSTLQDWDGLGDLAPVNQPLALISDYYLPQLRASLNFSDDPQLSSKELKSLQQYSQGLHAFNVRPNIGLYGALPVTGLELA